MEAVWGILIDVFGSWVLLIAPPYNLQNIRYIYKL